MPADDEVAGQVSLDPDATYITNFEIIDCATAGIPPDWLVVVGR